MESGQLEQTPTATLLRRLADQAATGCLTIEREGVTAAVYFRGGLVYTASAPEARPRLGDRLVGAGHITDEQLAETLLLQRSLEQPRRIGELLIERGLIDRETMRAYVREQIADSVAVALQWAAGQWTFDPEQEVPEDAPLDMSVENLLMEGARRLEEWEVIQGRIGSLDAVVDFAPQGSAAELSLAPDEWAMLTRIDGSSTIAEIAEAAGYGQFEAARIIYGLLTAGVVTLVIQEEPYDLDEEPASLEDFTWEDDDREPGLASALDNAGSADAIDDLAGLLTEAGMGHTAPDSGGPDTARPDARDDAVPAPADEPRAPSPSAAPVDRNELLREFAALDDLEDGDFSESPSPRPHVDPPPPRAGTRIPPPPPDAGKKKGLFGRFKKD